MAWNLPNDQQGDKSKPDPWTGRDKKRDESQPPNLEALLRTAWQTCLRRSRPVLSQPHYPKRVWQGLVVAVFVLWAALGLHYVQVDNLAYVMRWGVYQGQLKPGWQWRAYGVYQVKLLPQPMHSLVTTEVMSQDLNLAEVSVDVEYRVTDPQAYLFNLQAPQETVQSLAISALQQTIGGTKLATLLSEANPPQVTNQLSHLLQEMTNQANLGINITAVKINKVAIPLALQELFNKMNALYATQNTVKQKNAEYQQQVVPQAEIKAQKLLAEARTYNQQAVSKAQTDVADFLALLPSYEKEPHLTRYRLYTQSMVNLLTQAPTVIVATKGPVPTVYLGEMLNKKNTAPEAAATDSTPDTAEPTAYGNTPPNNPYTKVSGGYT